MQNSRRNLRMQYQEGTLMVTFWFSKNRITASQGIESINSRFKETYLMWKNAQFNWKLLHYDRHLRWQFHITLNHVWKFYKWQFDNHGIIWWIRTGQPEYSFLNPSNCLQSQERKSFKLSHDISDKNQSHTTYKKNAT